MVRWAEKVNGRFHLYEEISGGINGRLHLYYEIMRTSEIEGSPRS